MVSPNASHLVEQQWDEAIVQQLLRVVQPAAIESAIAASEEESHQRDVVLEALQKDLQAAQYTAQRAQNNMI